MDDTMPAGPGGTQPSRPQARRRALLGLTLFGAALGVAALAATALPVAASQHSAAKHPAAATNRVVVQLGTVAKYGHVLVDQKGLPLYYDTAVRPGHWACKGACLTYWPPLVLPRGQKAPVAGKGVTGLGVVKSPSGQQVTWHGKPLYTFIRDSKGKAFGQGLVQDGKWWLAQPVAAVAKKTTTTKGATSGSSGATTTTKASTWA